MKTNSRVKLDGFEIALADWISSNLICHCGSPAMGRNLFVSDMPEVEDIKASHSDFDQIEESVFAVYTDPGLGVQPGPGRGSRMEWTIRLVCRFGIVPEEAKKELEEVVTQILKKSPGTKMGGFISKGVNIVARPTVFARQGDGHAYATCALRFFVVTVG